MAGAIEKARLGKRLGGKGGLRRRDVEGVERGEEWGGAFPLPAD